MNVNGRHYRTIWLKEDEPAVVCIIDQRILPHRFEIVELRNLRDMVQAIKDMTLRGAPLLGVAGAYGMYLAAVEAMSPEEIGAGGPEASPPSGVRPYGDSAVDFEGVMNAAAAELIGSRPTAVNLAWGVGEQQNILKNIVSPEEATRQLRENAARIADADVHCCKRIGMYGLEVIREIAQRKGGEPVQILTHCNAGWLCAVDWGTATAPIYAAFEEGIPIHVWVDETRPRNQGASLTAWELGQEGVPYTLIADNTGGHLMQNGLVDLVIVGTDRVARCGDVANKIGTYLKALAAHANSIPFYVAAPSASVDWGLLSGKDIPIEQRGDEEVKYMTGLCDGELRTVLIAPEDARAANFGFDVTPSHLVTGLITERGVAKANESDLLRLFPEKREVALH